MKNIQRYTKGKFGRIEKHDGGEFVYYHNHDDEIREHLEREVFLNEEYEKLSYKYNDLFESKRLLLDKYLASKLSTKKYSIIAFLSICVNIGLLSYLWMN